MSRGDPGQVMNQGNIIYGMGADGIPYAMAANSTGQAGLQQREPFIFRPGSTALASGMVVAGSVTGAATVTTAGSVTTAWSPALTYAPLRSGKIDGISTGGIISGQLTVGMIGGAAATTNAQVTARIVNSASTAYVTCLALSAATSIGGTTEVFQTFDIPYLQTTAAFNAVPFDFFVGFQSSKAAASCSVVGRVISSSYIMGEYEPGT